MSGTLPDGGKGLSYTSRYAVVGANALNLPVILDPRQVRQSIAAERVDGTLKVHDAPLGIMTNAPTYDWHMTNLQNYINLSVKDVESAKLGLVTLPAFGSGSGLHGIPGDFTPPSRFVRAARALRSAARLMRSPNGRASPISRICAGTSGHSGISRSAWST